MQLKRKSNGKLLVNSAHKLCTTCCCSCPTDLASSYNVFIDPDNFTVEGGVDCFWGPASDPFPTLALQPLGCFWEVSGGGADGPWQRAFALGITGAYDNTGTGPATATVS